ncbi:MAG: nucleotidyltransferase family protein [Deltaproteobacteria bacterium]|nr:nucleotidyltransferase family protein [Deltaproteobacteria bacterium]
MDLFEELMGIASELDRAGVPYALVGGMALAVHGAARATTDIDLLVLPSDADRAVAAARARGFTCETFPMTFRDGTEIRRVTRVVGEESLTLDLMLVNPALEPAWASAEVVATDQGPLRVISREALIRMKVAAGRARDLADVERLEDLDR